MRKKLVKHGNSWALIIDKPIMELLGITPESEFEFRTDGVELNIRPAESDIGDEEFRQALDELKARHHETLKKLAE